MVVTPEQYPFANSALIGHEVQHFHLIVGEQFEYLVEEILSSKFPSFKTRPRINMGAQLDMIEKTKQKHDYEDEAVASQLEFEQTKMLEESGFQVERTFLCHCRDVLKDAHSVAQSSTEIHTKNQPSRSHYASKRGTNPRRVI